MSTNYYNAFVAKLKEIFMMDHAELDFGIYRIMNQKRSDIMHFLEHELLPQVTKVLNEAGAGDAAPIMARMKEIEAQAASFGASADNSPEYQQLKAKLEQAADTAALQNDVFSHLVTFFSRYYDNGDFISKRRYKDNTYAIPYNGEEVKLHWANADQYYIKSSEYFRDYSFVLPTSRRKVHFVLKDASTEQNNNKAANNMERRFALYAEEGQPFLEADADGLNIYFTYELMPKATKQDALLAEAFAAIRPAVPEAFMELLTTKAPTAKDANRTLLEKHLTDYTAKNSFDYFIHKDLGGFLRRELDFYIKNEVMHLDDLDATHISGQLTMIKAIKQVGDKIIRMLAQLEDFQKRLWLKKKFVVQSDYCITLDRVPEELYPEIIANDRQREEWVRLFAIDEIKGDMLAEAYSVPLTEEFLKQNPFLVLDTAFFTAAFKHKLIASMENIDEQCNGLLINSENFQALELLQEKYAKSVKCVYIDPPYNTGSDNAFAYKDNYQHSSWASMMRDRVALSKQMLKECGCVFISTDDGEYANVKLNLDNLFGEENFVADIIWNSRKSVSNDALISGAINHTTFFTINKRLLTDRKAEFRVKAKEEGFINPDNDPNGPWKLDPMDAPNVRENLSYGITNPLTGVTFYPPSGRCWRFEEDTVKELLAKGRILFGKSGNTKPAYKRYKFEAQGKGDTVTTLWNDVKTTADGTKMLLDMFGESLDKSFIDSIKPKPVEFISKVANVSTNNADIIMDYFAGSSTTAHAVILQERDDERGRKFIECEMNFYFDILSKPRIEKVIYSTDWREGKPISRNGISQCFKYIRLEQYEDTLNNLEVKQRQTAISANEGFRESYMLSYMLDTETKDSLLNLKMFENPFAMTLKTTKDNELVDTPVDMVETFNYLIGLEVETEGWYRDSNICVVIGRTHRDKLRTLVIWRNCNEIGNEALNEFFRRMDFRTHDSEFDLIYVNGDNTLPNLRRDDENWKVVLTEEEFANRMFENG
ncbi:MAG: site-specific DNA-methyltransferase [Bacteroidales bacterium]|nr:site-specific DNA-methyltransferase [Bacteroidales bacterium]